MKRSGPPQRRTPLRARPPAPGSVQVPRPRPLHARRRQRPLRAQRATAGVDWKAEATRLHSLLVRFAAGDRCQRCGQRRALECAHIVSRRYAATRTDESNGWGLCRPCHRIVDTGAGEHAHLVMRTCGVGHLGLLQRKARRGVKADEVFWRGEYERLLPRARALGLA